MLMSIEISYLIPSCNHEHFLLILLENISLDIKTLAVLAEVIIIDDGSSDNSPVLIQSWVEKHAKDFKISCFFQKNKGLAATLNKMIRLAEGQYLRLCASDDLIQVGSTQMLYNVFQANPQLLCVLADARVINEKAQIVDESSIAFHGGCIRHLLNPLCRVKELVQHWCVAGPSHLIKKSHYETMQYNESSRIDDYDLFLSILEIPNALIFIDEIVCLYRLHEKNTSKTKNKQRRIENIGFFLDIIDKYYKSPRLAKYLISVKYLSKAKIYFLQKRYIRCILSMTIYLLFKMKSELSLEKTI